MDLEHPVSQIGLDLKLVAFNLFNGSACVWNTLIAYKLLRKLNE